MHICILIKFPYKSTFKINEKLLINSFILVLFSSFLIGCGGFNRIEPNYEGVLQSNYGQNGISDFSVVTGSQGLLGPSQTLYQVPMYEQKADPPFIRITSGDNAEFSVDPIYTYEAIRTKGPEIIFNYKQYGVDDKTKMMDNIETGILNTLVTDSYREEARTYTTDSLIKHIGEFENNVETRLKKVMKDKFFQLNSLTSGLKPPSSMTAKIEDKNNVSQEVQTARNQLELLKVELEKQKIQAEINRTISSSLDGKVLTFMYIEAIRYGNNQKTVFSDGSMPIVKVPSF